jgi:hypothetical protein
MTAATLRADYHACVPVVLGLLASPLLGPSVWQPVARLLRTSWAVVTPTVARQVSLAPDEVLRCLREALPGDRDLVLVPHSNAGLYVPALTSARRVAGYVFVDAGLPAGYGRVRLAPPAFYGFLKQKVDPAGLLPPWTRWWPQAEVAALIPDAAVRARVEREQRRLPLSYFGTSLPVPAGWDDRPGAYLAFGDTYAADRQRAARRGWPVSTLPGGHLHMLVDPERVAAEIDALLSTMGFHAAGGSPSGGGG